jgi:diguanylate cyclase (GGDEF)-like protein
MLGTNPVVLQQLLQQLDDATLDHAVWRDRLLRVYSGRQPVDPNDVAPDAHRRCLFGLWYFQHAHPRLREQASFAMIGGEHEHQHRIATRLLRNVAAGLPLDRREIEAFEDASSRLSFALYFVRREVECALGCRDSLTDAYSSSEMLRDLREWHALARQPGRQCCISIVEFDGIEENHGTRAPQKGAATLGAATKIITAHLRMNDKVFRHSDHKLLVRLSGTDLASGKTVVTRLRDSVQRRIGHGDAASLASGPSAAFGLALLDPEVDVLESIDRADQAATLAKTSGRNRVICWDPSVTTGVRMRKLEIKDVES